MKSSFLRPATAFRHDVTNLRLGEFDLGGVLYHANYFHLYEMAREAFLIEAGIPYSELVANSQHLAIVESHQHFDAPIFYGDPLQIHLWISGLGKTSFTFNYQILAHSKPAHYAWTKHAFVAKLKDKFKIQPIPQNLRAALERYQ